MTFAAKITAYIRKHSMIGPGDRVGVAVSGGADSVALLHALYELRGELGCVLGVVHFNHKIRSESDTEAEFVEQQAQELGLEFYGSSGDARALARELNISLETAARELRYGYFSKLTFDKIATAHTLDDQAETVLMKLLRGAGTKGLSGIWPVRLYPVSSTQCPEQKVPRSARDDNEQYSVRSTQYPVQKQNRTAEGGCATQIIRPMLGVRRKEVEEFLRELGQEWCEDASNRDVKHTRNKVRHELLPLLEREYNPNIYQQLADAAEVARGEEEYWEQYSVLGTQYLAKQNADPSTRKKRSLGMTSVTLGSKAENRTGEDARAYTDPRGAETRDAVSLRVDHLLDQPLAVRRRVVRQAFERVSGKALDFEHTDALVRFMERRESSLLQLPERWFAVLEWPRRLVRFEEREPVRKTGTALARKASKKQGAGGGK